MAPRVGPESTPSARRASILVAADAATDEAPRSVRRSTRLQQLQQQSHSHSQAGAGQHESGDETVSVSNTPARARAPHSAVRPSRTTAAAAREDTQLQLQVPASVGRASRSGLSLRSAAHDNSSADLTTPTKKSRSARSASTTATAAAAASAAAADNGAYAVNEDEAPSTAASTSSRWTASSKGRSESLRSRALDLSFTTNASQPDLDSSVLMHSAMEDADEDEGDDAENASMTAARARLSPTTRSPRSQATAKSPPAAAAAAATDNRRKGLSPTSFSSPSSLRSGSPKAAAGSTPINSHSQSPATPSTLTRIVNVLTSPFRRSAEGDSSKSAASSPGKPSPLRGAPLAEVHRPQRSADDDVLFGLDSSDTEDDGGSKSDKSRARAPNVAAATTAAAGSTTTTSFVRQLPRSLGDLLRSIGVLFYLFTTSIMLLNVFLLAKGGQALRRIRGGGKPSARSAAAATATPSQSPSRSLSYSPHYRVRGSNLDDLDASSDEELLHDQHRGQSASIRRQLGEVVPALARRLWKGALVALLILLVLALALRRLPAGVQHASSPLLDHQQVDDRLKLVQASAHDGNLASGKSVEELVQLVQLLSAELTSLEKKFLAAQKDDDRRLEQLSADAAAAAQKLTQQAAQKPAQPVVDDSAKGANLALQAQAKELDTLKGEMERLKAALDKESNNYQTADSKLQESIRSCVTLDVLSEQIAPQVNSIVERRLSEATLPKSTDSDTVAVQQAAIDPETLRQLIHEEVAARAPTTLSEEEREKELSNLVTRVIAIMEPRNREALDLEVSRLNTRVSTLHSEVVQFQQQQQKHQQQQQQQQQQASVDSEDVRALIREAIALYDADKIGVVDFALASAGGSVVESCTSASFSVPRLALFGMPVMMQSTSPLLALQRDNSVGNCWAMSGQSGQLTVRLARSISITGFSVEHVAKSISLNTMKSAPRAFRVVALNAACDTEGTLLGQYSYDIDGTPLQQFAVQSKPSRSFEYVRLEIASNYGEEDYTCLYRFRVHGVA
ncbi:hypothetical protein CAOG_01413 [Capsaspora owczarzaki ATCC 30864]|uniref:SUN domain-containing protein n=1 Tax=Capsaspora owczarzaki (strain ATCC 30864) TaxID=595528 RepID=A0A0D2WKD5_CAPO3|nr:hypothetical protein CAOG_01413 [Capsaspora owczarzaki ATCC 30864]KJE90033.1 hypothetical protein CAOG_001413 [Capsaspora owczarzaki ATCC 30864]|eukprot:XP_004349933.1 hypothetical protein CAOG_01413 [Capsaspora owczarzaki ATCC 30864]